MPRLLQLNLRRLKPKPLLAEPTPTLAPSHVLTETESETELETQTDTERPPTYVVQAGDTLFTIAQTLGVRMSRLAEVNGISNVDVISVGQVLVVPDATALSDIPLVSPFAAITFSEQTIIQGRTLIISVQLDQPANLRANLEGRPIVFAGDGLNYWGLVGLHALSEVGVYEVNFEASLNDGTSIALTQNILVINGPYDSETIQVIAGRENLLAPDVVQGEFAKVSAVWNQISSEKMWAGAFGYPVDSTRVTSAFGTRRQYVGGRVAGFHAGTDFGGGTGTPIFVPGKGRVAMAEALDVRWQCRNY